MKTNSKAKPFIKWVGGKGFCMKKKMFSKLFYIITPYLNNYSYICSLITERHVWLKERNYGKDNSSKYRDYSFKCKWRRLHLYYRYAESQGWRFLCD